MSNSLRYAEVPAWQFSIAPKALPVDSGFSVTPVIEGLPTAPADRGSGSSIDSQSPFWLWTTMAALLGWAMTSLWLWRRPAVVRESSAATALQQARESTLFKAVVAACKQNRARACRRDLLTWAQSHFATDTRPTISELAARTDATELKDLLLELEQSLYSSDAGSWQGGPMLAVLRRWRAQSQRPPGDTRDALPPLYQ